MSSNKTKKHDVKLNIKKLPSPNRLDQKIGLDIYYKTESFKDPPFFIAVRIVRLYALITICVLIYKSNGKKALYKISSTYNKS